MNVFFDVDYTLIGGLYTLRPWTKEVFNLLIKDGHKIYIWSGKGIRREDMDNHGLDELITDYFVKPLWESPVGFHETYAADYRAQLRRLGINVNPDFVVDDNVDLVRAFTGKRVSVYMDPNEHDRELLEVYKAIQIEDRIQNENNV